MKLETTVEALPQVHQNLEIILTQQHVLTQHRQIKIINLCFAKITHLHVYVNYIKTKLIWRNT